MKPRIVPYTAVNIDASTSTYINAFKNCWLSENHSLRLDIIADIKNVLHNEDEPKCNFYPCLSVRTALDAFFAVQKFPPGSEVIISAINIPDIPKIILEHKLRYIPLDLDYESLTPNPQDLEKLITPKTVTVIIAHLYGKQVKTDELLTIAKKYRLYFIEDFAEAFYDLKSTGHKNSDLILFSFGLIKNYTAFGGGIMKVPDEKLYNRMVTCLTHYPMQAPTNYFKKLLKYFAIYFLLDVTSVVYIGMKLSKAINSDHKKYIVKYMRGFPTDLIKNIRHQPCNALLETLLMRLRGIDGTLAKESKMKGDFAVGNLPHCVRPVGLKAKIVNYWLFPVLVDNPEQVLKIVNNFGIDAFRGATQLSLIEPMTPSVDIEQKTKTAQNLNATSTKDDNNSTYPHKAKYIMDHVIYLPINRFTPEKGIIYICWGLRQASPKSKL